MKKSTFGHDHLAMRRSPLVSEPQNAEMIRRITPLEQQQGEADLKTLQVVEPGKPRVEFSEEQRTI